MGTRLFCKPLASGTVLEKWISELGGTMRLRSLDIKNDLELIHQWANAPYAKKFWQLDEDADTLEKIYCSVLDNDNAHSFICTLDEQPVCQIDVYAVAIDELREHIDQYDVNDAGLHILMCPPREMQKGWSFYALKCFQQYFFSFATDAHLYAEPAQNNYPANRLAINTGFQFLKTIELSHKTANLYRITRAEFFK